MRCTHPPYMASDEQTTTSSPFVNDIPVPVQLKLERVTVYRTVPVEMSKQYLQAVIVNIFGIILENQFK